ncbi:MAG: hypothetical protein JRI96_18645, partial [Deltaproteobacteria bacterium]|nr:hypothetical protein [Deltaproteobacteria bacterium]
INKLKKELKPNIIIRKTKYKGSRAGLGFEVIISELIAFKEIIMQISQNDYIAKIDSDVLFVSDKIFRQVITGEDEAVGAFARFKPGYPYLFMQGGCYLLKGSLVSRIIRQPIYKAIKSVPKIFTKDRAISTFPEDKVISEIVKQSCKIKILKDLRLPSSKADNLTKRDMEQYSVIHFSEWLGLKKEYMLEVWDKICKES